MMAVLRMMAVVMTMMMVLIDDDGGDGDGDYDGDDEVMVLFDAVLLLRKGYVLTPRPYKSMHSYTVWLEAWYIRSHIGWEPKPSKLINVPTYLLHISSSLACLGFGK